MCGLTCNIFLFFGSELHPHFRDCTFVPRCHSSALFDNLDPKECQWSLVNNHSSSQIKFLHKEWPGSDLPQDFLLRLDYFPLE